MNKESGGAGAASAAAAGVVDDLFRRESAHLVAALVRLLGPANVSLAEDVVHDALISALHAWQLGNVPDNPRAWILQVAKNRAIDFLRREHRHASFVERERTEAEADEVFAAETDNQLAMMVAICDDALSTETHVTLILRWLCGLSPTEIARAFLVDAATIDRRLHRGRARLRELDTLVMADAAMTEARQSSVEHALYLLFNEGYHGSDEDNPLSPAMCADAIRLAELLLSSRAVEPRTVHALLALFSFNAARLSTRMDEEGVVVPLGDQDRTRWDTALVARGIAHLGESAGGDRLTRWHLEAGIAFEHTTAMSIENTNWARIVDYYDALLALLPKSPIVALNRGLALAEHRGLDIGRAALIPLAKDPKLETYSFYWAARADIERRSQRFAEARRFYELAVQLSKSRAERESYERRLRNLEN